MLQTQTEAAEAETALLRQLLEERSKGPFIPMEEASDMIEAMLAEKRAALGL